MSLIDIHVQLHKLYKISNFDNLPYDGFVEFCLINRDRIQLNEIDYIFILEKINSNSFKVLSKYGMILAIFRFDPMRGWR